MEEEIPIKPLPQKEIKVDLTLLMKPQKDPAVEKKSSDFLKSLFDIQEDERSEEANFQVKIPMTKDNTAQYVEEAKTQKHKKKSKFDDS